MFKFQFKRYLFECKTETKASTTANKNKGKYHNKPMGIESLWGILNFFSAPLSPPPPSPLGYPYKPFTLVVYVKGKFPFSENVLGVFHLNQLLPHAFLGIQTCPVLPNTGREKATFKYFNKVLTKYNWKKIVHYLLVVFMKITSHFFGKLCFSYRKERSERIMKRHSH